VVATPWAPLFGGRDQPVIGHPAAILLRKFLLQMLHPSFQEHKPFLTISVCFTMNKIVI
jgi:hypothetical protein